MEFGEKLQCLRKSKGLTQEELAVSLYVSRTAISKWESGRGYPGIDSLKENAFGGANCDTQPAQMPDLQQRRRSKSRTAYYSKCYFTF